MVQLHAITVPSKDSCVKEAQAISYPMYGDIWEAGTIFQCGIFSQQFPTFDNDGGATGDASQHDLQRNRVFRHVLSGLDLHQGCLTGMSE